MKDSDDREEKKKEKKTNRSPSISMGGESFWNLSYPILLQPESQVSLGQDADPQASWGVTASWRSNSQAGQGRSASRELGPWASRGMSTFWDPWTGGSLSRLRHDNLLRTRFLGRLRQVNLLDWSWASPRSPAHMEGPVILSTPTAVKVPVHDSGMLYIHTMEYNTSKQMNYLSYKYQHGWTTKTKC